MIAGFNIMSDMANWDRISSRGRVEDRRGMRSVVGGVGLTGVALYLLVSYLTTGEISVVDVLNQVQNLQIETPQSVGDTSHFEGEDEYEVFASTVLGSNNEMWREKFGQMNKSYEEPRLVLFRQVTQSACGQATSAVGPHYCPLDRTIYLDETFFDELTSRFGARGGDVAEAYVIGHEVGHHVQNLQGKLEETMRESQRDRSKANEMSIAQELQADCYAGLWANSIKDLGVFEQGEIIEAMDAAEAVGDDRIQESVSGRVNPESWTHGSSEQRKEWFTKGYESGEVEGCEI